MDASHLKKILQRDILYLYAMKTVRLKIAGKVQGVFYRASAKEVADRYQLSGWIRNALDDTVEAMVTGEELHIEKFVEWCRQGPKKAIVTNVEIINESLHFFETFDIIR